MIEGIRTAARAVIKRNERILLLKKSLTVGSRGISASNANQAPDFRYALPGGGQLPGEPLLQTLARECQEETNATVTVKKLMYVAEWLKDKRIDGQLSHRHCLDFLFDCSIPEHYRPENGPKPDRNQILVEWVSISLIEKLDIFPTYLTKILQLPTVTSQVSSENTYLGFFK